MDLGFNGPAFTWRGTRNGVLIEERLDQGLANNLWQALWPNTNVIHGMVLGSDHCPIIIQCNPEIKVGRKLFRFEALWSKDEECREVVHECWRRHCEGTAIEIWHRKINDYKSKLIL